MKNYIEQKVNDIIIKTDICTLPIDARKIARRLKYNVKSYAEYKKFIEKLGLNKYAKEYLAFSLKYDNVYYIFVSDELTVDQEQKVIAHEIGHIVLHEPDERGVYGKTSDTESLDDYESDANTFAINLLAPLPILSNYNIESHNDIRKLTKLSINDSLEVYENYINYRDECCLVFERNHLKERSICHLNRSTVKYKITVLLLSIFSLLLVAVVLFSIYNIHTLTLPKQGNSSDYVLSKSTVTYSTKELDPDVSYYWTDAGKVFHSDINCRSLKNSSQINSGILSEAQEEKDRLCKFCEEKLY